MSASKAALAHADAWQVPETGQGIIADLTADAHSGLNLIARQLAQPLQGSASIPLLIAAFALAGLLVGPARSWAIRKMTGLLRSAQQEEFTIFAKAFGAAIITTICFIGAGLVTLIGVNGALKLLPESATLINLLFAACVMSGIGCGIGVAYRSSDDKSLRPVALPPGLGAAVSAYALAAGAILGLTAFIDTASRTLHASATSWMATQILLALAEIAMIARFLVQAGRARERLATDTTDTPALPAYAAATAAWIGLGIASAALLLGSLHFAANLLQNMLWAALVLSAAWLTTRFLDTLMRRFLGSERRAARFATGIVGLQRVRIEQATLLISALLGAIVWIIAILLVLLPLLGTGGNVVEQVRPGPVMQSIRALHLSPRSLTIALGVLIGGVVVTRIARQWLEQRFLPSTSLGIGARTSIATGLSYAGTIVALIAASGALGLQLDRITLIASALTVGVGFGLQAIIQNFVSGVILLFERPIQLGDRVLVSGSEGKVHRMRVRATELAADDGSIAIIPNSAFISSTVINKGDSPRDTSIEIEVTVAGCTTAAEAFDLLSQRITHCGAVDSDPPPQLHLRTLRESRWKFVVRFHSCRGETRDKVVSDLLFHLGKARVDGIRIHAG